MVTDPVQHIRSRDYATSLDLHLTDPLRDLASVTATPQTPYLTVCLDWTPAFGDPGRRPARGWFEREARSLRDTLDERSAQRAHLEADIERITAWLDELDPATSGAYIASSSGQDVFVPLALGVPMTNAIAYGSLPAIDALAHVAEDYATYAVLTCDQQVAALSFITQGTKDQGIYLESTLYPRKQMQGGPNQRRYQNRANERVFHFARAISGEVAKALREEQVAVLVLVGSDEFMKELLNEFPEDVRALVAGAIPMDIQQEPAIADLIDVTAPVALEAERAREARAVAAIREVLGGGRAVAGTIDVLNALQAAQAMSLVINEDYHEHGWADYTFAVLGIGAAPDVHPTGGDVANIVEVDLEEAFIRLAFQQGADVEIVHTAVPFNDGSVNGMSRGGALPRAEPAALLDDVGGVAAVLRYVP